MLGRAVYRITLAGFASLYLSSLALGKDKNDTDDGDDKPASTATLPNIYLDLRTNYATVPANMLSIGFSSPSLSTALAAQTLPKLTDSPLPTLSSPASERLGRCSLYSGCERPSFLVWRLHWQRIAKRHIGLVDVRGQQLERGTSGGHLPAKWRIDPDDDAAVDLHKIGAGLSACDNVL
jgi:hypothetical protein